MMEIAALVVAGGRGERAGGSVPKQYQRVSGEPMLRRTLEVLASDRRIGGIQVVIGADHQDLFAKASAGLALAPPVIGGAERKDSVRRGLEALSAAAPRFVLIHDAARPLLPQDVTTRVIEALRAGADAAIPFVPVADTLRRREKDGRWTLVPRENLHRAQTPQGFRFEAILAAHRSHAHESVTDDMALAELEGLKIVAVAGDERNLKITTPEDFIMAERLLAAEKTDTRTGFGYDAHRFAQGDHVWLCGVKIPHDHALEGHSDADAGLHALTDAILATIGAGDIGMHFPPTDEKWRGAPSWKFLDHAARLVRDKGGEISHCDVTLICERPKVGPHREAMRARIAEILAIDVSRVSVKATTTEGMGFTGRREGLAAQAVATVRLP
jgi:2-C-methyl-D-erythritol 4-phosphate cytidylyltransferase/2-C-methyl-D-erythritol 2,4-cyclodiphosphate synthase